jgi:predicted dienelactone hydrolase
MRSSVPLFLSLLLAATPPGSIRSEEKKIEPKPEIAASSPSIEVCREEPIDVSRDRKVPVKVYLPATKLPQAVVIFSHGLGGSRENSAYLGEHWAAHGYVAVFVQHAGSDEAVWKGVEPSQRLDTEVDPGIQARG